MNRLTTLLLLSALTSLAHAEMKCESGKCTSGKVANTKKIPEKPQHLLKKKSTITASIPSDKPLRKAKKPTVKQLFNVQTTKVLKKVTAPKQINYGYIVAEDDKIVDVVAWFSGFVVDLYTDKKFMKVKKGDALAKVYSPEVYKAKQDYLNALNFNAKRPSPAMVKGSRTKLELLNLDPKEIEAIEKSRKVDKYTTLYAPTDGWIFTKNINEGSAFNASTKLFQIVDLDTVWMEAKLYPNELTKLDKLENFIVKTEGVESSFSARKSLLYPELDPKEATATLRLVIENPKGLLKPGMYATVHASVKAQEHLLVPRTAVIRKNSEWYAFLATEFKGEYLPVKVEIKPLDNKYFEVLKGLTDGDEVVNNALFMMDSDAQINSIY